MTPGEIIEEMREDYLDDIVEPYMYADKTLLRYINAAQREVCLRMDVLYDESTKDVCVVKLKPGVNEYSIPQLITRLEEISFNGQPIHKYSHRDASSKFPNWASLTGFEVSNSRGYFIRGRKLFVFPSPDTTGQTLDLKVYRLPIDQINDPDAEFELPEEHHGDLKEWALGLAFSKLDADRYDPNKAQMHKAEFERTFGKRIPSDVRQHQLEEPRTASYAPFDYINGKSDDEDDW